MLLDPDEVEAGTIDLAVTRLPADDPDRRVGSLLWMEGGPGARGTSRIDPASFTENLREVFDIVGWDPRGTSGSSEITCIEEWDPWEGLDTTPDDVDELEAVEERTSAVTAACVEEQGDLIPHMGTYEAAHDLDALRAALGEEEVTAIGGSYGTRLGAVYATLFPERVRAMVLDGYDDADTEHADALVRQERAFERELDSMLDACAADPSCPLGDGGDPAAALDGLLHRLETEPLTAPSDLDATGDDVLVDENVVVNTTRSYLYDTSRRKELLDALAAAAHRGDGALLVALRDELKEWQLSIGLTWGPNSATRCADLAGYWDDVTESESAELRDRLDAVAPRLGAGTGPYRADPAVSWAKECEMQTLTASRMPSPVDATGAPPLLVIGNTGDVATPIETARAAVDELDDAALLTVESSNHTSFFFAVDDPADPMNRCVLDAVEQYLIDLELPEAGASCSPNG